MGFEKKTWEDRLTEFPKRRTLTKSDSSTEVVSIERNEGDIFQDGDKFSASNMNDLENRIEEGFKSMHPVGAVIHTTVCDTEQKVIDTYGGAHWIQHTEYFLRGASSGVTPAQAQADGGSDDAVVVAHSHSVSVSGGNHAHSYTAPSTYQESWDNEAKLPQNQPSSTPATTGYSGNLSMTGTAAAVGVPGTDANIPAYKSVYIWERVS